MTKSIGRKVFNSNLEYADFETIRAPKTRSKIWQEEILYLHLSQKQINITKSRFRQRKRPKKRQQGWNLWNAAPQLKECFSALRLLQDTKQYQVREQLLCVRKAAPPVTYNNDCDSNTRCCCGKTANGEWSLLKNRDTNYNLTKNDYLRTLFSNAITMHWNLESVHFN